MKYIRTKDNIWEVVGENDLVYYVKAKGNPHNTYSKSKCQTTVIKASDDIADLVDLYVVEALDYKYKQVVEKRDLFKGEDGIWLKKIGLPEGKTKVYGAIWIGLDLHCVAEMNREGELELL